MKKALVVFLTCGLLVAMATGASALVSSYDDKETWKHAITISSGHDVDLSFKDADAYSFTSAFLILTGSGTANVDITAGKKDLYNGPISFVGGQDVLTLDASKLDKYLNNHFGDPIHIEITDTSKSGFRLRSAELSSVAPEPVTLALVAAGLVGLPFARRLRKHLKKS